MPSRRTVALAAASMAASQPMPSARQASAVCRSVGSTLVVRKIRWRWGRNSAPSSSNPGYISDVSTCVYPSSRDALTNGIADRSRRAAPPPRRPGFATEFIGSMPVPYASMGMRAPVFSVTVGMTGGGQPDLLPFVQ